MLNLSDMRICDIIALKECHVNCETYRSRLSAGDSRHHALRPVRTVRRAVTYSRSRALEIMSVPVNPAKCRYYGSGAAYASDILKEGGLGC